MKKINFQPLIVGSLLFISSLISEYLMPLFDSWFGRSQWWSDILIGEINTIMLINLIASVYALSYSKKNKNGETLVLGGSVLIILPWFLLIIVILLFGAFSIGIILSVIILWIWILLISRRIL